MNMYEWYRFNFFKVQKHIQKLLHGFEAVSLDFSFILHLSFRLLIEVSVSGSRFWSLSRL